MERQELVFEGKITRKSLNHLFDQYTNLSFSPDKEVSIVYRFTDFEDETGKDLVEIILESYARHRGVTATQIAVNDLLLKEFALDPLSFYAPIITCNLNKETTKRLALYCRPAASNFLEFLKDEVYYTYFIGSLLDELSTTKQIDKKEYSELLSLAIQNKGKEVSRGDSLFERIQRVTNVSI